ncbi:MAG: hypothetical protein ABMA00_20100, partial [Gemmatimonas sp.]
GTHVFGELRPMESNTVVVDARASRALLWGAHAVWSLAMLAARLLSVVTAAIPVMAALIVATSCRSTTDPFDGYLITVGVSPGVARIDAPTTVTTTVTNHSGHPRTLLVSYCVGTFRVATTAGKSVELAQGSCYLVRQTVELRPDASFRYQQQWDGRDARGSIIPGTYLVYGQPFASNGPISAPATLIVDN